MSSMDDPFFVVREEVSKAVNKTRGLYQRWCELHASPSLVSKEEIDWTTNELRNSLRSIEWDLEDLEETIGIVEKNPRKFRMDDAELQNRKQFVTSTRAFVKELKDHVANPDVKQGRTATAQPQKPAGRRPMSADAAESLPIYITDTQQQQERIIRQQDDQLDQIGNITGNLRNMSSQIGHELDEQANMLDDMGRDMDHVETRMDGVMKKMAKVLHMSNDKRQWTVIFVLLGLLLLIIILFIVL